MDDVHVCRGDDAGVRCGIDGVWVCVVYLPESAVKPLPLGMGIQGVLLGLTGVVVDTY